MGRPADTHVDVYYDDNVWWGRCIDEVKVATFVLLGSYMYDDEALHQTLLSKLGPRRNFSCNILVDRQSYEGNGCRG
jgi:hypothetical protein